MKIFWIWIKCDAAASVQRWTNCFWQNVSVKTKCGMMKQDRFHCSLFVLWVFVSSHGMKWENFSVFLWKSRDYLFLHTCRHLKAPEGDTEVVFVLRCVTHRSGCRGVTWLLTAAGALDSTGPSWAATGPEDRVGPGPDRANTGVCPPCLRHHHRAPGALSCPDSRIGICTGSRSPIRIASGDPLPLTDSAGSNHSTGSGTANSAAGRSAGSWEESSTCPVRNDHIHEPVINQLSGDRSDVRWSISCQVINISDWCIRSVSFGLKLNLSCFMKLFLLSTKLLKWSQRVKV